jgi:hypothetical protein
MLVLGVEVMVAVFVTVAVLCSGFKYYIAIA